MMQNMVQNICCKYVSHHRIKARNITLSKLVEPVNINAIPTFNVAAV